MAPLDQNSIDPSEKVTFVELESLLRKSLACKELEVITFSATKLLPLGENYCSVMVKLDATIRRQKDEPEERLFLVAKTPTQPASEPIVDWPQVFEKELFIYTDLVPAYRNLEREAGIEENDLLDVLPKYIGHRRSLEEHSQNIDENSLTLMENLKARGFYSGDRRVGLDVHHARLALTNLARYHALGIVLKQKQPNIFDKAAARAQKHGINFDVIDPGFVGVLKIFESTPRLTKHYTMIERSFKDYLGGKPLTTLPEEPWATITHGDFWVNNMMFHKDEAGNIDDVKFVDFQTYLFNSPLKDVAYFMCGSLDVATTNDHFEELLDAYYETFRRTLERMDCDSSWFTKDAFQAELKRQAVREFPLCALVLKFFMFETNGEEKDSMDLMSNVFESKCSSVFEDKLFQLVSIFEKRGWF